MRHFSVPRSNRGLTIPELLIASALFAMVTASMALVMREGVHFFNTHTAALQIQQQALQAMDRVATELSDASSSSFKSIRTASQSGIIIGSNRNANGEVTLDTDTGQVQWHKHVGYYVDKSGNTPLLMRKEIMLAGPETSPPPIPATMNLTTFADNTAAGREGVIARYIVELYANTSNPARVTLKADYLKGRFTLNLNTFILLRN